MIDFQEDKNEIDFKPDNQSQTFNTNNNIDFQPEAQNNGIDFQPTKKLEGKIEYNEELLSLIHI